LGALSATSRPGKRYWGFERLSHSLGWYFERCYCSPRRGNLT